MDTFVLCLCRHCRPNWPIGHYSNQNNDRLSTAIRFMSQGSLQIKHHTTDLADKLFLATRCFVTCDESYLVMKILYIFAFDTNLQYFAFSYISIICSLYLHKFSYDSQIHNVLTCVNTLHFSEWNLFNFFLHLTICMIQKLGCMIHCVSHPF